MGDSRSPPRSPEESNDESNICSKLMKLLVGYSRRWKNLLLGHGVKSYHQRALENLVADDVPLLETVRTGDFNLFIDFPNPFHGLPPINGIPLPQVPQSRPAPMSNVLCKLSSLRSLHLQQGSMLSLNVPLDWARLTELSFNFRPTAFASTASPIAILQRIAQTCHSLVILTFRSRLTPGSSLAGPVIWSSLRELRLTFDGPYPDEFDDDDPFPLLAHLKDVYSSIITPQLLHLTLQLDNHERRSVLADNDLPFHTLVKGAPHLTHLQIISYHILGAEALSRCLQGAPSLTTLKLEPERAPRQWSEYGRLRLDRVIAPPADWAPKLLSSLNELDSCPQLEVLDCGRCRTEDITSILEFVQDESRLSKLKQLRADMGDLLAQQICTMTSPSLVESLNSLRAMRDISVDFGVGRSFRTHPGAPMENEPLLWLGGCRREQLVNGEPDVIVVIVVQNVTV
ncbi:hypothetical protein AAF712_002915 [Marasmius tenuissimus]|uniref:Uncharacterized protein n=1 Tax=Marasmius tenuissimus TaxID=585030 RepID=A0ABR3A8J9_9AGAR